MDIIQLYDVGVSFKEYLDKSEQEHRDEMLQIINGISLTDESIGRIRSIHKKVPILVCSEPWCPDCRVNLPVLQKMKEYNNNIEFRIVSKEIGGEFFNKNFPGMELRIPTFIICGDDFSILGAFVERPGKLKDILMFADETLRKSEFSRYREGQYTEETVKDVLEIIG